MLEKEGVTLLPCVACSLLKPSSEFKGRNMFCIECASGDPVTIPKDIEVPEYLKRDNEASRAYIEHIQRKNKGH